MMKETNALKDKFKESEEEVDRIAYNKSEN